MGKCVAGDDDSGGGLTAEVEFLTVIDQPYFIYVHSAFVNSGDNEFCFTAEGLVSLPPVDIPTLSQWFIIILGLSFLIFGVIVFNSNNVFTRKVYSKIKQKS